jgi:hypothetical protein
MEFNELYEYRTRLLDRVAASAGEFSAACRAAKDPFASLPSGEWNTHQLAAHVRDVDKLVYADRIRRTVEEEQPVFRNFDADAWVEENYRSEEPLEQILAEFQANISAWETWVRTLPNTAWSRTSRHEVYGPFAMQAWVERGLAHIEEHLAALRQGNTPMPDY